MHSQLLFLTILASDSTHGFEDFILCSYCYKALNSANNVTYISQKGADSCMCVKKNIKFGPS